MYTIELEKGVWLSSVEGDPGRTLDINNAKKFKKMADALKALNEARKYRPFLKASISSDFLE